MLLVSGKPILYGIWINLENRLRFFIINIEALCWHLHGCSHVAESMAVLIFVATTILIIGFGWQMLKARRTY